MTDQVRVAFVDDSPELRALATEIFEATESKAAPWLAIPEPRLRWRGGGRPSS